MRKLRQSRSLVSNPSKSRRTLVKAAPAFLVERLEDRRMLSASATALPAITSATTTVNAGTPAPNSMSAISNVLGVNLEDTDSLSTTAQTDQMIQAAGLNVFRFMGGTGADETHFNVDPGISWGAEGLGQFGELVDSVGGTGIVTVDYGSGSPQEAVAELAYLEGKPTDTTSIGYGLKWNNTTSAWQNVNWQTVGYWASLRAATPLAMDDGLNFLRLGPSHTAPFTGINDWEIGNEQYGSYAGGWETDHHGTPGPGGISTGSLNDPATYAKFAAQFAAFATGDTNFPTIRVGIDSGSPIATDWNSWTQNVLTDGWDIGYVPGFISDHLYMESPGSESDSFLLNDTVSDPTSLESGDGPMDWSTRYGDYQSLLVATLGSGMAKSVQVMATEFNSVAYNPGKQSTSLVNGLFVADSLGSLMESDYTNGLYWSLRNGFDTTQNNSTSLYGWREGGDYGLLGDPNYNDPPVSAGYVAYPSYFAEQLVSKIAQSGGEVVSAASNSSALSVYAVKETDGDLDLLVINKNPSNSMSNQFDIAGFQPGGSAQVWQYGENQDTAQENSMDGAAALANSTTMLSLTGSNFSYTFPAYSMTVLDLPAASAKATPTFSNLTASSSVNYGTASVTFSGAIAAGTSNPPSSEAVAITLNGVTDDAAINPMGSFAATFNTSSLPASATPYQATYAYAGDANFNPVTDNTTTQLTITPLTPSFSNLTAPFSISYGTAAVTLSGTIAAGAMIPPSNEGIGVWISLDGTSDEVAINAMGGFSTSWNTSTLPASATPYQVTYAYDGDANFNPVTDDTTTTLTVNTVGMASITVTPPGNQTASAGQSKTFSLGSFAQANTNAPYAVTVNWGDASDDSILNLDAAGAIPATAHTYAASGNYTVTLTVTSFGLAASNSAAFNIAVAAAIPVTPTFSNLSPSSAIPQATAMVSFYGTIAAGTSIPPSTESVAITLDGVTQSAAIGSQGNFSTTFNTSTMPASATPYQITYAYAGDASFNSITDDTTTELTISDEEPVYRLYSPVTLEHLYTTDANEYNTLKQYVGTWNPEGDVFSVYSGPVTLDGVTDEPLYRLYDAPLKQHFWTDDYNEYNTLRNAPWNWNDEGVVGYVFPTAVASGVPLYRMMAPQVHLWTTDVNEYNVLTSDGWTQEGIIGYVL